MEAGGGLIHQQFHLHTSTPAVTAVVNRYTG